MTPPIPSTRTLRTYAIGISLWLPAVIFLSDHIASLHVVRGRSMTPTLSQDLILVRRWGVTDNLRRGQVVLYRSPTNPETVAIKRIVGLEGDTIKPRDPRPPIVVPRGKVWVEGDEGFHSVDSNHYGAIPRALIAARVTHVVWPVARAGRVREEGAGRFGALVRAAS